MASDAGDDFDDDAQSIFEVDSGHYTAFGKDSAAAYALPSILQSTPSSNLHSSHATQGSHNTVYDYTDPFDNQSYPEEESAETQLSHVSDTYYAGRRQQRREEVGMDDDDDRVSLVSKNERPSLRHRPSTNSNPGSNGPSPSSSFRRDRPSDSRDTFGNWRKKQSQQMGRAISPGASSLGLSGYEVQGTKLAPKRTLGVVNHAD